MADAKKTEQVEPTDLNGSPLQVDADMIRIDDYKGNAMFTRGNETHAYVQKHNLWFIGTEKEVHANLDSI